MRAIVVVKGMQFMVEPNDIIDVPYDRKLTEGETITLDNVLLIEKDNEVIVGEPTVKGAKVVATVKGTVRGEKVTAFKKKRRTGYKRKIGHRQNRSRLEILEIKG
ncbi:50S ribosomal protein L21 [bacterium]|nr:50S ribosomal protein L21 [bacterium]